MQFRISQRQPQQVLLQLMIILDVAFLLAVLDLVQRRLGNVDMSALDQLRHLPVEEGEQQGADVRAVHVRVGHDDDAVVAQLVGVVFVLADAGAERGDQRGDFLRRDQLVETRFFDVQDFAFQRQDRLEFAIAALLGGAAGGIALDQIKLALAPGPSPGSPPACRASPCRPARPCAASTRALCAPLRAPLRRR